MGVVTELNVASFATPTWTAAVSGLMSTPSGVAPVPEPGGSGILPKPGPDSIELSALDHHCGIGHDGPRPLTHHGPYRKRTHDDTVCVQRCDTHSGCSRHGAGPGERGARQTLRPAAGGGRVVRGWHPCTTCRDPRGRSTGAWRAEGSPVVAAHRRPVGSGRRAEHDSVRAASG